jgi:serine protease
MKNWMRRNISRWVSIAAILVFSLAGNTSLAAAEKAGAPTVPASVPTNQIIIKYKTSTSAFLTPARADQMGRLKAVTGRTLGFVRSMSGKQNVLRLPAALPLAQVQQIAAQLMTLPEVQYAVPDQRLFPVLSPNDPYYGLGDQWDMNDATGGINAPQAWDITTGSTGVVVADVDTGLVAHADLAGRMVSGAIATSGYDFISDVPTANDGDGRDADPSDPGDWVTQAENNDSSGPFYGCGWGDSSWHGTHTAGTIGAMGDNGMSVAGVNWVSKLLIVRVLGKCGGDMSDVVDGITWAVGGNVPGVPDNTANKAKVINLSLGGQNTCEPPLQDAINYANTQGAVVVAAAGNYYPPIDASNFEPANCSGVIPVAATNRGGSLAFYSSYGSIVKISAPGGEMSYAGDPGGILSTMNTGTTTPVASPEGDEYVYDQGTSMAAPHVTGVVSLMFSVNPTLTPEQVLSILQSTARPFPSGNSCFGTNLCGSGILDAGAAVVAARALNTYALTVNKTGSGSGTVTSNPNGIDCGSICSHSFYYNTLVALTATPATGSTFTGWTGACSGTSTCQVRMTEARSVSAEFTLNTYRLDVSATGNGSGTITSDTDEINCGTTCSASFDYNTQVTLTATPGTESTFSGWSGDCKGTEPCKVTIGLINSVSAEFTLNTYRLDVSTTGSGTVTSNPAGINCGSTCSQSFDYNTPVTLTATPDTGSTFSGWSDGCTGTDSCNVSMSEARTVSATFTLNTYLLTIKKTGNGTVTSSPAGISCDSTCSYSFDYNTPVTLTASPATGSIFSGWSVSACSGTGTCLLTIGSNTTVSAAFIPTFTISGNAKVGGVSLTYFDVITKYVTSASDGSYSITIPQGWSRTVTPTMSGVTFTPTFIKYSNVTANMTGQDYTARVTTTFTSTGSQDGWILESIRGSGKGGSLNASASTVMLGDDKLNRQYRGLLSFNTASLPDNAIIQSVVLKIKQSGGMIGSNPFSALGSLYVDIRKGYFGSSSLLQVSDFNAAATASKVGTFGKTPVSGWYSATLNTSGRSDINKTSLTQLRLYFSKATNAFP